MRRRDSGIFVPDRNDAESDDDFKNRVDRLLDFTTVPVFFLDLHHHDKFTACVVASWAVHDWWVRRLRAVVRHALVDLEFWRGEAQVSDLSTLSSKSLMHTERNGGCRAAITVSDHPLNASRSKPMSPNSMKAIVCSNTT